MTSERERLCILDYTEYSLVNDDYCDAFMETDMNQPRHYPFFAVVTQKPQLKVQSHRFRGLVYKVGHFEAKSSS